MKKLKNKQELKEQAHKLRQFLKSIKETKETDSYPKRSPVCKDPNFGASLYPPYPVDPWDMPGDRG
jgi:hypothetical protein